jgi:hypothetical protein
VGYALCVVLALPLLALTLMFTGHLGVGGVAVAAAVTTICAAVAWNARRRADAG